MRDPTPQEPTAQPPDVIVGIDGSAQAESAARWAADLCARRHLSVELVSALPDGDWYTGLNPSELWNGPRLRGHLHAVGEKAIAQASVAIHEPDPSVQVTSVIHDGAIADYVRERSPGATFVVIGSSRTGRIREAVLGGHVMKILHAAECPVLVWRDRDSDDESHPHVVVGVDDSANAERALLAGLEYAQAFAWSVTVAHFWPVSAAVGVGYAATMVNWSEIRDAGCQALRRQIAPAVAEFPTVDVGVHYADTSATHGLVELSSTARLVVVGTHGRGTVSRTVLGSVSDNVVHHARCPVLVVP